MVVREPAGIARERRPGSEVTRRAPRVGLGLGAAAAAAVVLWPAADMLLVVFAGLIVGLTLRAAAEWVAGRLHVPTGLAVIRVTLAVLGAILAGALLLADELVQQVRQLGTVLPQAFESIYSWLNERAWGQALVEMLPAPEAVVTGQAIGRVGGAVWQTLGAALGFVAYLLIALFVALYIAMNPSAYSRGVLRLVPVDRRPRCAEIMAQLATTRRRWFVARLALTVIVGAVTAGALALIGVPMPLALGILAGVLNFIPYLGPIVAFVPIALVALLQSPMMVLWVLLLYLGIQELESHILTPLLEQQAVQLPPAVIITAQVVLAMLVGILGVLLATPLAATVLILVRTLYVEDALGDSLDAPPVRPSPGAVRGEDRAAYCRSPL